MEDKKRKKEEKRKKEASQKVTEHKGKVPDLSKPPPPPQPPASPRSASPSPGPPVPPSPAAAATPPGGSNAKRPAVPNGQPPPGAPAAQRYMAREVPPRFRGQQDHKVLLRRGQPPLSCMLLGGGGGAAPPLEPGDASNAIAAAASESSPGSQASAASSLPQSSSSSSSSSSSLSSSVAAAASSSSNYANSTWGAGSGSQPLPQGREQVIVDGSDLDEWPSIAVATGGGDRAVAAMGTEKADAQNSSASWMDSRFQRRASGAGDAGNSDSPSPPSSSSPSCASSSSSSSSSCTPDECMQSSGVAWGCSSLAGIAGGVVGAKAAASSSSPGPPDDAAGESGRSPGASFSPSANPSAWPALGQDGGAGAEPGVGGAREDPSAPSQSANPAPSHTLASTDPSNQQKRLGEVETGAEGGQGAGEGEGGLTGDPEQGAGPKNSGEDVDCGTAGDRGVPPPPPQGLSSKTGAWEGGGTGGHVPGEEGGAPWGRDGSDTGSVGSAVGQGWGAGSGGGKTPGATQGEWGREGDLQVGAWGNSGGGAGMEGEVCDPEGRGSSHSSSCSGGSGGKPPSSASPPPGTTTARAWDNQKGIGEGGAGEWGGPGQGGGGGTSSSSGGGHSGGSGGPAHLRQRPSAPPPSAEVALQSLLSRADLDPRVLSNTGWGQTQIRQNSAWDTAPAANPARSRSANGGAATADTPPPPAPPGPHPHPALAATPSGEAGAQNARNPSGTHASAVPSAASGGSAGAGPAKGGGAGGWGGAGPAEGQGKGWGSEGQEWRERRGEWAEFGQQGAPAGSGGGGGWGGRQEQKDLGREGGGWGQGRGGGRAGGWAEPEPKAASEGWGEGKGGGAGGGSETGSWGSWDEGGPRRGGGGGGRAGDMGGKPPQGWGAKAHSPQIPNSQAGALKGPAQPPLQQSQAPDPGPLQGAGWARPGGPPSHKQNQSWGWTSGPVPQATGEGAEPSGWEEPSPHSISRKMEIDDGTSAWGDPSVYSGKSVNLWDKNSGPAHQPQGPAHLSGGPAHQPQGHAQQQPPAGRAAHQPAASGNPAQAGKAPALWGGSSAPSGQGVDNGTATWGKAESSTGWGDLEDSGKSSGWGNPSPSPVKSGSKSMQEGWGGEGPPADGPVGASRHSSWEEEEEGGGVWSSAGSQGSGSSYNSGSWGHGGKKSSSKGALKGGAGDSWVNPVTRQFSNMGLLGEEPSGRPLDLAPGGPGQDKKQEGEKRGMSDYNGEMRKGGRGGGGGGAGVFRSHGPKDAGPAPSEPGSYYDKTGGHGVFGGSGGMAQSRGVHQPGVPSINPSPGIRAQVPHQFLSPQVPGSVLKQMAPPTSNVGGVGGVGGGVFPPQLSPQHIAMLSNIYPHVQQFHLACQLLLQQQQQQHLLQNQRKFSQNLRQAPDPQQLARVMAILQQQQRQQQGMGSKLSPSHLGGGGPKQPMADPLPHPGMGGSLADLHPKTPGGYSGFPSGVNLSGLELSGGKDGGGQQSRFKWMMENRSPAQSPPDSALHKNGPLSTPGKMGGGSPYSHYELLGGEGLGVAPQGPSDAWHRTPGSKMGAKMGTSSWPPEFQPGVPWKGIQSTDPESDPYMTPGSALASSGASGLNDPEHQLLQDNTEMSPSLSTLLASPGAWPCSASDSPLSNTHSSAKYTDYKPSWPPDPIGHNKLWKSNRNSSQMPRPPPGLTNQKQSSPSPWVGGGPRLGRSWVGTGASQEPRYGSGSAWSEAVSHRGSCWLVLSNLTPQIDGSTLRTICMQHGPLLTFHLGQGSALIRYSTQQEAAKAQSALHMCVLGNTTILAEFVSEEEVSRYFAHSQAGGGNSGGGGGTVGPGAGQALPGTGVGGGGGGGGSAGSERERSAVGSAAGGGGGNAPGGSAVGSVGPSSAGWKSLDGTGSSPDTSSAQGPGLSIFAQWSSNGAGGGAGGVAGGGMDTGRAGLWAGMTPGYHGSSLWGAPQMEDRHQMGSPAALLPGDLLGGGADSI